MQRIGRSAAGSLDLNKSVLYRVTHLPYAHWLLNISACQEQNAANTNVGQHILVGETNMSEPKSQLDGGS